MRFRARLRSAPIAGTSTPPPVAAFSGTPLTGTDPLEVDFTDESTGTPTSWLWERNDGGGWASFSTDQNPANVEFTEGTWSVRLTATNAGGSDGETKTDYITVGPAVISARYWRFKNFTGTAALWETQQIQVMAEAVVISNGIVPTASVAPDSGGGLDRLTDNAGLGSPSRYWTTANANTLILTFDFTSDVSVTGFRAARYDTDTRFATSVTADYSANGTDWTAFGTATLVEPLTNNTMSATGVFA